MMNLSKNDLELINDSLVRSEHLFTEDNHFKKLQKRITEEYLKKDEDY